MVDSNLDHVSGALQVKAGKFLSKSSKSVSSRVTTINANAPVPVTVDDFKNLLKAEVSRSAPLTPLTLSEKQITEVCRLRDEKYATWQWNYGQSPAYNMRKEQKFPAGLVTVFLTAQKGHIQSIRFFGDFFGNGTLSDLEQRLNGLALSPALIEELKTIDVGYYMNGISAEELYALIML